MKASKGNKRARHFFGWDSERRWMVMLSGIVKEGRKKTPRAAYKKARKQWERYKATCRIRGSQ
ncbi:MAG: hypothetical protein ACRD1T_16370 [Acidimicrobiia bacterium]